MASLPEAVLIDIDGVLHVDGRPVPDAPAALARVRERGLPLRLVTNTTARPRHALAATLHDLGFAVEADEIFTAVCATGAYLRSIGAPRTRVYAQRDLSADLAGVPIVDEAPEAVVVGDLAAGFTYDTLNEIFRQVLDGARLVGFQANRYWRSARGLVMDAGPFLRAIEYASGVEAVVVGKPSAAFFHAAAADARAAPERTVMVGDDVEIDVGGAQAAGLAGVLVRTGKYRHDVVRASGITPRRTLESIAELPDALEGLFA